MVVIARKVGRLANRLLLFAHFIGTAVEYGFRVVNPAFGSDAHYFPSTADDLLCRFPRAVRTVPPMGRYGRELLYRSVFWTANALHVLQSQGRDVGLIRLRRDQSLDLDGAEFLSALQGRRVLFVQDWFFRSSINCEKHGDVIRSYFKPWERHCARRVRSARGSAEHIRQMGVLLRRGPTL
jgi:hypothetical protein